MRHTCIIYQRPNERHWGGKHSGRLFLLSQRRPMLSKTRHWPTAPGTSHRVRRGEESVRCHQTWQASYWTGRRMCVYIYIYTYIYIYITDGRFSMAKSSSRPIYVYIYIHIHPCVIYPSMYIYIYIHACVIYRIMWIKIGGARINNNY